VPSLPTRPLRFTLPLPGDVAVALRVALRQLHWRHIYKHGARRAAGERVFGLAAGSMGSHVVTPALTLAPIPAGTSFEDAATMPTVFLTVDSALHGAARLGPGSR
jgi:hypothetical protein